MTENLPENQKDASAQNHRKCNHAVFYIIIALAVLCLFTRYILCYCCGYYQTSFGPMGWNYLLAIFGFLLLLGSFVIWAIFLICKRRRVCATYTVVALLLLAGLKFIVPWPHDLVLYGLRNGMLRHSGIHEMRDFAADLDKLPPIAPDADPPNQRFYDNQSPIHGLNGTGLKEKYPFLANCEFIRQIGNVICVNWGGLDNHWGFYMTTDGKPVLPSDYVFRTKKTLRVSDGICFFSEY